MRLERMNWSDVEKYLQTNDSLIFITGATEQHSTLSLFTDILIPCVLADAVVEREPILIAPPLNYGCSPYFQTFPGTVSLRLETFVVVIKELAAQFIRQGFNRIFFLNGHGGNPMNAIISDLAAEYPNAPLTWHNWWQSPRAQDFAQRHNLLQSHANWQENFPFTRIGNAPSGSKPKVTVPPGASPQQSRTLIGDGSYGGDYQVSDTLMEAFMSELVDEITVLVRQMKSD